MQILEITQIKSGITALAQEVNHRVIGGRSKDVSVDRGENMDEVTQGFSEGDTLPILKDKVGGSGWGRANSRQKPVKLDRVARGRQGGKWCKNFKMR